MKNLFSSAKKACLLAFLFISNSVAGQMWFDGLDFPANITLDQICAIAEAYIDQHNLDEEERIQFYKWAQHASYWIGADGKIVAPSAMQTGWAEYQIQIPPGLIPIVWNEVEPTPQPSDDDPLNGRNGGVGRVNVMRESPEDSDLLYIGTAGGGIWKSTNAGDYWNCLTDAATNIPCWEIKDLAVGNGGKIYALISSGINIGSGGGSNLVQSLAVSTDGGSTWRLDSVGTVSTSVRWRRLVLAPPTSLHLFAAATGQGRGLYESTDGGNNWVQLTNVDVYDIEVGKPAMTHVFWATATANVLTLTRETYVAGSNFSTQSSIQAGGTIKDVQLTRTSNGTVYAMVTLDNAPWHELYKTTNWQTSLSKVNIQVYPENTSMRPHCFQVSPGGEVLYTGNMSFSRSTDGGVTWTRIDQLLNAHLDFNGIHFGPGTNPLKAYLTNDAGVYLFQDPGQAFPSASLDTSHIDFKSTGLNALQGYRLSVAQSTTNRIAMGTHDNGSYYYETDLDRMTKIGWGDGMDCAIKSNNPSHVIFSTQEGSFSYKNPAPSGATVGAINVDGVWVTPLVASPTNSSTVYIADDTLRKSTNFGSTWSSVSNSKTSQKIQHLAFSPGGTLFAAFKKDSVFEWSGSGWLPFLALPTTDLITGLEVDPYNQTRVLVCLAGVSGPRVMYATRTSSWQESGSALPGLPMYAIVCDPTRSGDVYAANAYAVYYHPDYTNPNADWELYVGGLPNVACYDLDIHASTRKLFAATSGRGIWWAPLKP